MSAAAAWLRETVDAHGEALADGRVRVRRSQAALAEEAGCSPGTIAYYLRVLGDAVTVSRREGLVIDGATLAAFGQTDELARRRRDRSSEIADVLAGHWGTGVDSEGQTELRDSAGRAPSVRQIATALGLNPSTTQRHLENLSRQGRLARRGRRLFLIAEPSFGEGVVNPAGEGSLPAAPGASGVDPQLLALLAGTATALVRVAEDLAELGRGLLDVVAAANGARVHPCDSRPARAQFADSGDGESHIAAPVPLENLRKAGRSFLSSSPVPRSSAHVVEGARADRGDADSHSADPTGADRTTVRCSPQELQTALLPLQRASERLGLPSVIDERGRRWLSGYTAEELGRGVTQVLRQLQRGIVASPLGLLVSKAKAGDENFFAAPPAGPAPAFVLAEPASDVSPTDPEAAAAVASMTAEELAELDEAVRVAVEAVFGPARRVSVAGVLESADGLALWRARVWRERQSQAKGVM